MRNRKEKMWKKTGITVLAACIFGLCLWGRAGQARAAQVRTAEMFDLAGLFTPEEEKKLLEKAEAGAEKTATEMVFLTYDDAGGKSTEAYTDDFCDEQALGYDPDDREGAFVMLAFDMDNREIFVKTGGTAIDRIGDDEVEEILDAVFARMPEEGERYYEAAAAFPDAAVTALSEGSGQGKPSVWEENMAVRVLVRLSAAALAGAGATALALAGRKTGKRAGAAAYMGSEPRVVRQSDRFINTTVIKTRIPDQSSGGNRPSGGGSSHVSSGGRSYGGGGRSF